MKSQVAIVMGSDSDWKTLKASSKMLDELGVPHDVHVVSAHRTPDLLFQYAEELESKGIKVVIAGAGGAAHLPGMLAAKTIVPIYGVPVASKYLRGEDSLYSIVQMPKGIPVATFAIGEAGAANAALHVIANLAVNDPALAKQLEEFRAKQSDTARSMNLPGY
jgi:5-(carboxyamino)imidazole ribonucleotide mutase